MLTKPYPCLLLFLLTLSSCWLAGQSSDYIITAGQDTLYGKIVRKNPNTYHHEIYFQARGQSLRQLYLPDDILGFRVGKRTGNYLSSVFIPEAGQVFTNGTYFMLPVVEGDIEVYEVSLRRIEKLSSGDRFNYSTAYLVVENGRAVLVENRAALRAYRSTDSCSSPARENGFDTYAVGNYFVAVARCAGGQARLLRTENNIREIDSRLRIYADVGYYSYNWLPVLLSNYPSQTYLRTERSNVSLRAGRMVFSRLEARAGLSFGKYQSEAERTVRNLSTGMDTTLNSTTVEQTVLSPEVSLYYHLPLGGGKATTYGSLGLRYAVVLKGTTERTRGDGSSRGDRLLYEAGTDSAGEYAPTNFSQFTIGAGVQFELGPLDPYLEVRYFFNSQFLGSGQTYVYRELGVNLGVRF